MLLFIFLKNSFLAKWLKLSVSNQKVAGLSLSKGDNYYSLKHGTSSMFLLGGCLCMCMAGVLLLESHCLADFRFNPN